MLSSASFNVQIRITPPSGSARVETVRVTSLSANHAKGQAAYDTQRANGGCQVEVVDVFEVPPPAAEPTIARALQGAAHCYGCSFVGDNACGYRTCSSCLCDSPTPFLCVDEETNRHLCADCLADEHRAATVRDADTFLAVLLADDFAAQVST